LDSNQIQVHSASDRPYDSSYGQWTVKWWQWAISIPKEKNPLVDSTGQNWITDQPKSNVWFLAGIFGGVGKEFPRRRVKMESGRSILLPVLNCAASSLEYPDLKTPEDLINHVVHDVGTVVRKDCFINGKKINPVRVRSDPIIFKVTIDRDNAFGVNNFGTTDASADGYWVFLKPLPKGNYQIQFQGACEFGRLSAGANYDLEII
jgi:hypothetical protein